MLIWDVENRRLLKRFHVDTKYCDCIAWSPDGSMIAFCNGEGRVFDTLTGKLRFQSNDPALVVAWSPDGRRVVFGHDFKTGIRICSAATGSVIWKRKSVQASDSLAFAPDSRTFAVAGLRERNRMLSTRPSGGRLPRNRVRVASFGRFLVGSGGTQRRRIEALAAAEKSRSRPMGYCRGPSLAIVSCPSRARHCLVGRWRCLCHCRR